MNSYKTIGFLLFLSLATHLITGCKSATEPAIVKSTVKPETTVQPPKLKGKPVIYQVLPRLFGNENKNNKPWGHIEENGVGKFNDFTGKALQAIKEFGISHIWYTGILHHALIGDYTQYGISNDDPDVVKGRAGSPYAIKDYYNVNPDLAEDPNNRLAEFKALIDRTHHYGMKVIIDIVPNHIARNYQSISKPEGVTDFGSSDDVSVEYRRDNNFYYIPGKAFKVPKANMGYQPLGGDPHPLADGKFDEFPAKWTGNGSRKAQPDINDWYETVKINYGVRPDGSFDFPRLPDGYRSKSIAEHFDFWSDKDVPNSWEKFREIALYWTALGVDGFRFDIAELVPVEFWSYLNSAIKQQNKDALLIAEVYNPKLYRDYLQLGKMDYLYDKVGLYDSLKLVMTKQQPTSILNAAIDQVSDINSHMLNFLENHDEQRIASSGFAADGRMGKPAMVVSALVSPSATMLYFAQALGEPAIGNPGFGSSTRSSIFDYWGIDSVQRWRNNGAYDSEKLTIAEKSLRDFYVKLLSFSSKSTALTGSFADLHSYNAQKTTDYDQQLFSFSRWDEGEKLIIISNFSATKSYQVDFKIPAELIQSWGLEDGSFNLNELLQGSQKTLKIAMGIGNIHLALQPFESKIFQIQ